jgi:hypothetical protein
MTDDEIRKTLRRLRRLVDAVAGPLACEVEVEDPSGAILDGIVSPSLRAARDPAILDDLLDLDDAIEELLAERASRAPRFVEVCRTARTRISTSPSTSAQGEQ